MFSVDVEPGKPLLKLPYNKTDDPWHAAQKFIHDNNLSQNFLDEVANFIIRNSGYGKSAIGNSSSFVDPFTGKIFITLFFKTDNFEFFKCFYQHN